jgi:hypothetical protein
MSGLVRRTTDRQTRFFDRTQIPLPAPINAHGAGTSSRSIPPEVTPREIVAGPGKAHWSATPCSTHRAASRARSCPANPRAPASPASAQLSSRRLAPSSSASCRRGQCLSQRRRRHSGDVSSVRVLIGVTDRCVVVRGGAGESVGRRALTASLGAGLVRAVLRRLPVALRFPLAFLVHVHSILPGECLDTRYPSPG